MSKRSKEAISEEMRDCVHKLAKLVDEVIDTQKATQYHPATVTYTMAQEVRTVLVELHGKIDQLRR